MNRRERTLKVNRPRLSVIFTNFEAAVLSGFLFYLLSFISTIAGTSSRISLFFARISTLTVLLSLLFYSFFISFDLSG